MCAWFRLVGLAIVVVVGGCTVAGPASLGGGRSAYNRIVNQTEDEQLLSAIVRHRYDETFGMLAVTSITANMRTSSTLGVNAGVGPRSAYDGNLVPLSAGVTVEENPTIAYVPVRGEEFVERMLAPLTAEQTLLLSRMSTPQCEPLRLLLRRVNGRVNPLFASGSTGDEFEQFVVLFTRLREQGVLDVVRLDTGAYEVLLHDLDEQRAGDAAALLATVGLSHDARPGTELRVPLAFFVGSSVRDAIEVETPTALEVLRAAAQGVDVPQQHVVDGIARARHPASGAGGDLAPLVIHSSRERPERASVAVAYRDWWFFVDDRDASTKQAFVFLRTLIGLRLDTQAASQQAPVLTVPVGR